MMLAMGGGEGSSAPAVDRDLRGALVYGVALAVTAVLGYAFNAAVGRQLSPRGFATFVALLGGLLVLSGPTTALFGGAAMAAARTGARPRPRAVRWVLPVVALALVVAFLPIPGSARAFAWFAVATPLWLLVAWNRGLLIGFGRMALVGASMILEGFTRIGLALAFLAAGLGVVGASAGLALGIGAAAVITQLMLPRQQGTKGVAQAEVGAAIVGLLFLGLMQFADVIAVRVVGPERAAPYAAASSLARLALYAQIPAAAYAIRRAATAGAGRAVHTSWLLALGPAIPVSAALILFPGWILDVTYDGHYLDATGLVRVLTVAMLLAGMAQMLVQLMMGAGRVAWVYSTSLVGAVGVVLMFLVAGTPFVTAWIMVGVQAVLLGVTALHARRLLAAERGAEGSVLILSWRDRSHPQGGGSEVYVEEIARRLAGSGREVTIFCADHAGASRDEVVDGVRYVRRGSWRTVYLWAAWYHVLGRFSPHDVVIDVQNAVPFFAPVYCGRPVVVLVHHLHREQWQMIFPRFARFGWWVESRLAPKVYRRSTYVTVSEATKADLVGLGVDADRIEVVRNGSVPVAVHPPKAGHPVVTYLGRLVPHKRVEYVLEAAASLRPSFPSLEVHVVGQGPWDEQLKHRAHAIGLDDVVTFHGHVDDDTKMDLLARSWALALPSVNEGWGLAVMEAASVGTPAVAWRAGGLAESVVDGTTGLLADDVEGFTKSLHGVLSDRTVRDRLGEAARERAARFSWDATAAEMERVLDAAVHPAVEPQPVAPVPLPVVDAS
jgi:glycosyltransferase involved in cell wall biosynthesis/O-antigen/teichoic acid export membrane protein